MAELVREDLLRVRAPGVCFHVLRATDGLYLIDAGFVGGLWRLQRSLREVGWGGEPIRGILLTHGHLDHVLNVAPLVARTGAWVAAPAREADHLAGRHAYTGAARVCGGLEALGRAAFGFRRFAVDRWLDDGTEIPVWHGLTTVALPGHTQGHVGFLCSALRLLFSGDLFASYGRVAHLPPAIFNDDSTLLPSSVARALSLDVTGVIPNHGDRATPAMHRQRLRELQRRIEARASSGRGGGS